MRNYFLGIENAILFEKITKNQNEIKPILLIGLYIIEEEFGDKIIFLPKNF